MFPLQRGNELVIQFSNTPTPTQQISQDPILDDCDSPRVRDSHKKFGNAPRKKKLAHTSDHNNSTKKMIHREIERQRRQEMATLYASLRSLLPLHYIKGKRSISDHMNEAVNYIKHLQKNIKELGAKRDELKKQYHSHDSSNLENHEKSQRAIGTTSFTVHQKDGALGIEICSGFKEQRLPLSKLLELLLQQQGLEVVSCVSTQVNGRILHSVLCEVNNSNGIDLAELRRKVANVISSFN